MKSFTVLFVLLALAALAVPAPAATVVVAESGGEYADLQTAVDAAGIGDSIEVRAGAYPGSVIVDKPLTITGSGDDCRIGTDEDEYALFVTSEGVTLRGLAPRGSDVALSLNTAHSASIEGCRVEGGERGILIADSRTVTLAECDISADFIAMEATNASQARISGTRITGATEGIVLQQVENATLSENRIEDCGIGIFIHDCRGGVLEDTAFSRVRGGVALFGAGGWEIRGSVLESVDQYLDSCMSSGCRIEAETLDGPDPFASDAVSANRYEVGTLTLEGRDFSLSADATAVPGDYVQFGEGFRVDFLDVTSAAEPMVSVEADAADLDLTGTESGTLGIYRIDGTVRHLSAMDAGNSTVAVIILEPGSYALMARQEGAGGLPLAAAGLALLVVLIAAALFIRRRRR